jgi:hypothetical protein
MGPIACCTSLNSASAFFSVHLNTWNISPSTILLDLALQRNYHFSDLREAFNSTLVLLVWIQQVPPPYSVSSQEIWVLILRGKSTGCFYFMAPEQQQTLNFSTWTDCFYEQASSRTLWLKAFPCKPCKNLVMSCVILPRCLALNKTVVFLPRPFYLFSRVSSCNYYTPSSDWSQHGSRAAGAGQKAPSLNKFTTPNRGFPSKPQKL